MTFNKIFGKDIGNSQILYAIRDGKININFDLDSTKKYYIDVYKEFVSEHTEFNTLKTMMFMDMLKNPSNNIFQTPSVLFNCTDPPS